MNDRYHAEQYRRAQAAELILRYERANGHPAESSAEMEAWVAANVPEGPIEPSKEAYSRIAAEDSQRS